MSEIASNDGQLLRKRRKIGALVLEEAPCNLDCWGSLRFAGILGAGVSSAQEGLAAAQDFARISRDLKRTTP